ncbi:MAG: hypothetical protein LBU32_24430 [Clostridiales bacterium]|nr:hypothetical protein [Clostridiales bacterium]
MDLRRGIFEIEGKKFTYVTSRQEFVVMFSGEFAVSDRRESPPGVCRYHSKGTVNFGGIPAKITVRFIDDSLLDLDVFHRKPELFEPSERHETVAILRKSNDKWLIKQLGPPHETNSLSMAYKYQWGTVTSSTDQNLTDSIISIEVDK